MPTFKLIKGGVVVDEVSGAAVRSLPNASTLRLADADSAPSFVAPTRASSPPSCSSIPAATPLRPTLSRSTSTPSPHSSRGLISASGSCSLSSCTTCTSGTLGSRRRERAARLARGREARLRCTCVYCWGLRWAGVVHHCCCGPPCGEAASGYPCQVRQPALLGLRSGGRRPRPSCRREKRASPPHRHAAHARNAT